LIVHHDFCLDETSLPELNQFQSDKEGDGDEVGENEDPRASCLNEQQPPVGVPLIVACIAEFQVGNVQVINHPRAAHD